MKAFSSKEIDDAMHYIVEYYSRCKAGSWIDRSSLVSQHVCDEVDVDRLISVLCGMEFITYGKTYRNDYDHIELTKAGKCYLENRRKEKDAEKKEVVQFWLPLVKDVLLFLAGLFTREIIAFLRSILNR